MNTKAMTAGVLKVAKVSNSSEKTFLNDAIHIWNLAPMSIKNCDFITSAKKAIKVFVTTLPV